MFGLRKNSFSKMQDMIVNSDVKLSDVLRRTKLIAAKLGNDEFRAWVEKELNGYSNETEVPEYRRVASPPLGTFSGLMGKMVSNFAIPASYIPDYLEDFLKPVPLVQSVNELTEMAKKEDLRRAWPPEAVLALRDTLTMEDGSVVIEIYQPITSAAINGVLDAVRNRLQDFFLELQGAVPDLLNEDASEIDISSEKVSQIFNYTITGSHNVIASGSNISQEVSQYIGHNEEDKLLNYFRELGIGEDDLNELSQAIKDDCEPAKKGELGPSVSSWYGRMASKAASGVWKISAATAPALIVKALSSYYGWG